MDREGSVRLLSAILADLPRLPGAVCAGPAGAGNHLRGVPQCVSPVRVLGADYLEVVTDTR